MINRFSSFPTEKVKIIKASGLIIDNVDAFMSNNMFLIEDGRLDIEENDIISRSLPNGKTEEYLVIDRGFKRTIGSFPEYIAVSLANDFKFAAIVVILSTAAQL